MRLALMLSLLAGCREDDPKAQADLDGDGVLESEDCNDLEPAVGSPQVAYLDSDGDGVGGAEGDTTCDPPTGYTFVGGDCNDGDPSVAPTAPELCDGVDNNCDGEADEGLNAEDWYPDADGDGFGDGVLSTSSCAPVEGFVTEAGDCDDANVEVYPGAPVACTGGDQNCDGSPDDVDADGDRFLACEECDDQDVGVDPGAAELCDGRDQDCDGAVDEDALDTSIFYDDVDGDGSGDPATAVWSCSPETGQVADGTDCDDGRADVHEGADELCDTVDNDCDGEIDENAVADGVWYVDADGDGHGELGTTLTSCDPPAGYVATADDCDDDNAAISPDASELCNGVDDDCDGDLDDADAGVVGTAAWWVDEDGDGYAGADGQVVACDAPINAVTATGDCDDTDALVSPDAVEVCDGLDNNCDGLVDDAAADLLSWYADIDGDGHGDAEVAVLACDAPAGMVADPDDCDDSLADVYPGAAESCDGADNDCDGEIDEGALADGDWYADTDGDGWGDPADVVLSCDPPAGYTGAAGDCDDTDGAVFPGAGERCDGADEDCDGLIDADDPNLSDGLTVYTDGDGDGFGDARLAAVACAVSAGASLSAGDCDDDDPSAWPGAAETCDGDDDDCDGVEDNDATDAATWYGDGDGDGYGDPALTTTDCTRPTGYSAVSTDCDDADNGVHPGAAEQCDALDQDCDGSVDESAIDPGTWAIDYDGDGYGSARYTTAACDAPPGWVADTSDCDDAAAAVFPGATERCNGVDDDCDLDVDETDAADAATWYLDADADGHGDARATTPACSQPTGYVSQGDDCDDADAAMSPSAAETCNGLDDDCDGAADDGAAGGDLICAAPSCQFILDDGSSTGDGLYWLDPDDDGDRADAWEAWCDMTTDGGGWTRIYASLYPTWWDPNDWERIGAPTDDVYSDLGERDWFADGDVTTWRLEVGDSGTWNSAVRSHYTVWSQEHDPFTEGTDGSDYTYIAGLESTTCGGFNGLHNEYYRQGGRDCVSSDVDVTESYSCWWMQIVPLRQYSAPSSYPGYLEGYYGPNIHIWHVLWLR